MQVEDKHTKNNLMTKLKLKHGYVEAWNMGMLKPTSLVQNCVSRHMVTQNNNQHSIKKDWINKILLIIKSNYSKNNNNNQHSIKSIRLLTSLAFPNDKPEKEENLLKFTIFWLWHIWDTQPTSEFLFRYWPISHNS